MASWIWVLIPLAAIFAGVITKYMRLKEKQIDSISHKAAEEAARHAEQTRRLEERMRVLERIVTDRGLSVAEEIDRLRDDRGRGDRIA